MAHKTFHEILKEVHNAKTKKEKIGVLHHYSSPGLKQVLGYTYDPTVEWLLPEGTPPYKAMSEANNVENRLASEMKRIHLFVNGPSEAQKNLKQVRREELFIEILENIDPRDAKVLIGMKERKLPYKGLTRKLVAEAFPNMTKHW